MPGLIRHLVRRWLMGFEADIAEALEGFAAALPPGATVLDAGCGEALHRTLFGRQRYVGVDLAVGDGTWDYSQVDTLADLAALPFRDRRFDAAISIVTLEHVRDPARVLGEIGRVLKPGGRLLIAVPMEWEVHQAPHDYYRYTRHGLEHLLRQSGFGIHSLRPSGGVFRIISRRILDSRKQSWLLALLLAPLALILPAADFLDRRKDHTLGYVCEAYIVPSSAEGP
jgi:SAM-dependent methyltransferase